MKLNFSIVSLIVAYVLIYFTWSITKLDNGEECYSDNNLVFFSTNSPTHHALAPSMHVSIDLRIHIYRWGERTLKTGIYCYGYHFPWEISRNSRVQPVHLHAVTPWPRFQTTYRYGQFYPNNIIYRTLKIVIIYMWLMQKQYEMTKVHVSVPAP